jgi:hypothetical protein
VRLTLRTLLAYLDDTLQPTDIKTIGAKVAESEQASELIDRIKQVTRKRSLSAPTAFGPNGTDANDVAEYLDNELESDQIADLERLALESDAHLAEIASCHQILALVLGEPIQVPPKAKERMYGLVRGKEAIPNRKAQPNPKTAGENVDEESLNLSGRWLRWVLPAAGLLLVAALGLAIYQALPATKNAGGFSSRKAKDPGEVTEPEDPKKSAGQDKEKGKAQEKGTEKGATEGKNETPEPKNNPEATPVVKKDKEPEKKEPEKTVERVPPPTKDRVGLASYRGGGGDWPTVLAVKEAGKDSFTQVPLNARVSSSDTLVTLPGFVSYLETSSGVGVLMRGYVPEFAMTQMMAFQMESAVILHTSETFDLDLTLLRGRIFLSNRKERGPCKIRLRFATEVWDIVLSNPRDEILVDLARMWRPDINHRDGEEPFTSVTVALLQGEAEIRVDAYHTYTIEVEAPKWAWMSWNNFSKAQPPTKEATRNPSLTKNPPPREFIEDERRNKAIRSMELAVKNLGELLKTPGKSVAVALKETRASNDPVARQLAIYGLGAIDDVSEVVNALGDEDPTHGADRFAAFSTLQRWISRDNASGNKLFNKKDNTGLLLDKKYKPREAEKMHHLLYPPMAEDLGKQETYEALAAGLKHNKPAIAELCFLNLLFLAPTKMPPGFNAAAGYDERERYAAKIQEMIDKKQIPPQAPQMKEPEKP